MTVLHFQAVLPAVYIPEQSAGDVQHRLCHHLSDSLKLFIFLLSVLTCSFLAYHREFILT